MHNLKDKLLNAMRSNDAGKSLGKLIENAMKERAEVLVTQDLVKHIEVSECLSCSISIGNDSYFCDECKSAQGKTNAISCD